jgi:nitroreductase
MTDLAVPAALSTDELLTTTRAVRRRLDLTRPVPLTEVVDCLRIAQQAPCGTGQYRQHWVVVSEPAVRAEIGRLYRASCDRYRLRVGDGPGEVTQRSADSADHLANHLAEVPVLVLACLDTGGPLVAENQASLWATLLPAVWSYMLAARGRGLGTVWTTRHLAHADEIAELLGIPPGVHQAALIPTAYHLGTTFRPASRPPFEESLHVDRW